MSSGAKVRALGAKTIAAVLTGSALDAPLAKYQAGLGGKDQGFLAALAYGTLRRYPRHAAVIEHLLRNPKKPLNPMMRALLALGLEQIVATRVPAHAAVSATVAASRLVNQAKGAKFLNAILRRYLREREEIDAALGDDPRFVHEHPKWLVQKIAADWPENWQDIVAANNLPPPMWLRVNLNKTTRESYLQRLQEKEIVAQPAQQNAAGIRLPTAVGVDELPEFAAGCVSVQDINAQVAASLVAPRPGERILDACAAPGGKTGHLLEICEEIDLTALDLSAPRLARVADTLDRLGVSATLKEANATDLEEWWDGRAYDAVLVDAPCSGSGVIRRHPDIKTLRRPRDATGFAQLQRLLIQSLWKTVAPGGRLIYATCSIFPEENEGLIEPLAESLDGARPGLPNTVSACAKLLKYGVQMFPEATGGDGFYYAVLWKDQERES
ncbi:MAG: 16S rRNA (cytosine(967)-C(5))-methyltransferase RsmB [Gammaproteobacteria bacterium]|nr:16S rRNA (cytosine(967)-C(5))-methyltransferase RsmB [Gammaproteobacteria bacterium]